MSLRTSQKLSKFSKYDRYTSLQIILSILRTSEIELQSLNQERTLLIIYFFLLFKVPNHVLNFCPSYKHFRLVFDHQQVHRCPLSALSNFETLGIYMSNENR